MSPEKRQKVLAYALAGLASLLGVRYLFSSGLFSGGGPIESSSRRSRSGDPEMALSELATLDLAKLENKPAEFSLGRDPFRFYIPPPPPAPPPPTVVTPAPAPPAQVVAAQPQQPATPRPPAIDVSFLGSFGPDRGRIGVFSDGTDLYNARVGDVVKTHFVVNTIGYESADLSFINFPDEPAQRLAAGG